MGQRPPKGQIGRGVRLQMCFLIRINVIRFHALKAKNVDLQEHTNVVCDYRLSNMNSGILLNIRID